MAAPVDAGRATTNSTVSGTTHSLNLPGSIASGDVLVAEVRCPASTTISWPAGWTEWEQSNVDASDDETSIAYRIADGTEGATITITLGTARILVGIAYRITGGSGEKGLAFSAATTGSASQPDSPNLQPTTANKDILWLSIGGCDDSETLTSGPTGYSNATVQGSTVTGASGCTVYGASKGATGVNAENPGAWTLGSTSIWTAWTVAVSSTDFPPRITQEPVEVATLPTSQKGRITQEPVEVATLPTSQKGRITQLVTEAVIFIRNQAITTQVPVEIATLPTSQRGRITQIPVEAIISLATEVTFIPQVIRYRN